MPPVDRIPFVEAISEAALFKASFEKLSVPQRMILKAIYGAELNEDELRYWSAFSGAGIYDDLGFLRDISHDVPYVPQEYGDVTLVVGRRSGKTHSISSFVVAYEALCGGHKSRVGERQDPIFLQIAQDLSTARNNLRMFILDWLASSPIGKKELEFYGSSAVTADTIRLKRGIITVGPPTIKLRGAAIACCAMDELCVWPKDREASNPDVEVERAVNPALMQFYPFGKLVKVSTPMTEEGLLWIASNIGTGGRLLARAEDRAAHSRTLVLTAPTAAMGNPKVSRDFLIEQKAKDAEAFPREYLAQFSKSVSGFLNVDLLRASVQTGVTARPPREGHYYVGTLDPAFRRDAFAFTIGHMEGGAWIQDYIHAWRGSKESPLRPGAVLDEIASVCYRYGIRLVTSDQYHSESLMELAMSRGLVIESVPLTSEVKNKMWGDFNSLLLQNKIQLVDYPDLLDELLKMERTISKFGNVQYAGGGRRDDLAMVTALAVYKAAQTGESIIRTRTERATSQADQVRQRVQSRVKRERSGAEGGNSWWL